MKCEEKYGGWTGCILKVDLSTGKIEKKDSCKYVEKFIGGKGLNHRLAWDELAGVTDAFSPENCLFISVGPLTGTAAPNSGRATIGGISPQSFPEMYTHSGVGGWFPPALKYAGYDAVIIKGISPYKCYLYIDDETVNIKRADHLWGLGTYETQRLLKRAHGMETQTLCIGPAGENKSRVGILLTDTENAAGQGGFGGVAGSKNLKAVCVLGGGSLDIAHPKRLIKLRKDNMNPRQTTPPIDGMPITYDEQTTEDLPFRRNRVSCSHSCDRHCFFAFHDVPGVTRPDLRSGKWGCVGMEAAGWQAPFQVKWPLWGTVAKAKPGMAGGLIKAKSAQAGFEVSRLFNQYGINAWDLIAGMVPWLVMASRTGVIDRHQEVFADILPIDEDDPEWWVKLIKVMASGKGKTGELLAQGNYRAIKQLGKEFEDTMYGGEYTNDIRVGGKHYYRKISTKISLQEGWGYPGHWSGRGIHSGLKFPYYLMRALPWMTASRDPMDDTHIRILKEWEDELEDALQAGADPYTLEIIPRIAIWNENRSELKSSLTLCDWAFPNIENPALESQLFSAVTGMECTEEELDTIGERCKNLQRALLIRDYDRDFEKEFNEIMPWFERPDGTEGISVDREKFLGTVQEYYRQRGWGQDGRPSKQKLESLGLHDIAEELYNMGKITG